MARALTRSPVCPEIVAWNTLLALLVAWHCWALALARLRGPAPELAVAAAVQARPGWVQEFRAPELVDGAIPTLQGLTFTDTDTLLFAAATPTKTVLYRVDVVTRQVTGRAESAEIGHLNSIRVRANGEVWGAARIGADNVLVRIDPDQSFRSGSVRATELRNYGYWGFSVAFAEVDGAEYALIQQWAPSLEPQLFVLRADDVTAPAVKSFRLGLRIQDVAVNPADGLLYASRNVAQGESATVGWLESYDVVAAIRDAPDGATLAPVARHPHATKLVEGVAFRPGDGRVWSATEGLRKVGDGLDHVAVWSAELSELARHPLNQRAESATLPAWRWDS